MPFNAAALVLVVVLAASSALAASKHSSSHSFKTSATSLNFLAIGDWGGQTTSPYTTPAEVAAGQGMGIVATNISAEFVLGLGDNFYEYGLIGNDKSPRFLHTFENCFDEASLQVPWYIIAGNHDHISNVSAQIAYTKDSTRWKFPSLYYNFSYTFNDGQGGEKLFELIYIDTVVLTGNTDLNENKFDAPPGPADVEMADDQWQWIEDSLSQSTANYLVVAGHYPVWSACEHGNTQVLVDRLKPLLEKYKVSAYLSGHDHCLEHIWSGTGPMYSLSGAGKECCYSDSNKGKVPSGYLKFIVASGAGPKMDGGFSSYQVSASQLEINYYDQSAKVLYTASPIPPRKMDKAAI